MNRAPRWRSRTRGPVRVGGFSLLELIIVLAILAMLLAVAWPSLRRPVMRSAAQQAARQLVKDLARARMAAIDSGQVMRFRFEPGGIRYVVELAAVSVDGNETTRDVEGEGDEELTDASSSSSSSDSSGSSGSSGSKEPYRFGFAAQLSDDVVFRDPSVIEASELPAGSTLAEMLQDERQETEEVKPRIDREEPTKTFSAPVFFYPTGRAENAEFVLQGPDEYRVTIRLRGLTGAASTGPLEHPLRKDVAGKEAGKDSGNDAGNDAGKRSDRPAPPEDRVEPDFADE
ncbi:MAG: pilus assembly FimT family protein [Pirellulaceae bacterium]